MCMYARRFVKVLTVGVTIACTLASTFMCACVGCAVGMWFVVWCASGACLCQCMQCVSVNIKVPCLCKLVLIRDNVACE